MRRFATQIHDPAFSFNGAVHALEARLIEQALDAEIGNVASSTQRLGLKRPTLDNILRTRHRALHPKRTPPEKWLKSIIKKDA